jgi:hypothetical protein
MAHEIEIFRTGQHTSSNGVTLTFTEADLRAAVDAYDPSLHEAPVVAGHPKDNAPALGWVRSLRFDSGKMQAGTEFTSQSFVEQLRRKEYKKRSASFYPPSSPSNPQPGVYYLRHVGFLGAAPPSVKGLKDVEFGDADDCITVEFGEVDAVDFGDWDDRLLVRLLRGLRDLLIEKWGKDEVEKAMPSWDIDAVHEAAARPDEPTSSYAEPKENPGAAAPSVTTTKTAPPTAALAPPAGAALLSPDQQARVEELALREQRVAGREAELSKLEADRRVASYRDFCEAVVKEGRPLPCEVDVMVGFCQLLAGDAPDVVSFGEGVEGSPVELFQQHVLARLPKQVSYGEFAPSEQAPIDLAEDASALAREIVTYQREHKVDTVAAKEAVLSRGK